MTGKDQRSSQKRFRTCRKCKATAAVKSCKIEEPYIPPNFAARLQSFVPAAPNITTLTTTHYLDLSGLRKLKNLTIDDRHWGVTEGDQSKMLESANPHLTTLWISFDMMKSSKLPFLPNVRDLAVTAHREEITYSPMKKIDWSRFPRLEELEMNILEVSDKVPKIWDVLLPLPIGLKVFTITDIYDGGRYYVDGVLPLVLNTNVDKLVVDFYRRLKASKLFCILTRNANIDKAGGVREGSRALQFQNGGKGWKEKKRR